MIEVRGLNKSYGAKQVLHDFNLKIEDGSVFGLVGINGAGKSTLLRLLSGVIRADKGSILYDGEEIYENEKRKQDLFFLPDEPFFNMGMNGNNLQELYASFYTFNKTTFKHLIETFKLNLKTPIRNFSKGMRRQLYISLAFACAPKYLILDEAFDGLDPLARLEFKRNLINLCQNNNSTVIIASHSLRELEDICDSFGLIDGGQILSYGNISDNIESLNKFQVGFEHEILREQLEIDCLTFESTGRIVQFVTREDEETVRQKLKKLNPILIDKVAVDFEELFVGEVSGRGYLK